MKLPYLSYEVPVVEGTYPKELKSGVGHFAGSMFPRQVGNVVLSGHRNTGLRKLKDVKKGDQINFEIPYGEFVYEITEFKITGAKVKNIIVPTDYETITLMTCYLFEYIGDAPDRFIVYTKLVSKPNLEKSVVSKWPDCLFGNRIIFLFWRGNKRNESSSNGKTDE